MDFRSVSITLRSLVEGPFVKSYPYFRHGWCACLQWKPFANAVITNLNFGEWRFGIHETRSLPCINRTDSRLMPRASNWQGSIFHDGINGSFPDVWNKIDNCKTIELDNVRESRVSEKYQPSEDCEGAERMCMFWFLFENTGIENEWRHNQQDESTT